MAPFAFEIFEHGDPVLLEPLTCKKPALELELAAGTLESTLLSRWSSIQDSAVPGSRLRLASDFWPSKPLLEKAAAALISGHSPAELDEQGVRRTAERRA